ncbi:MAG: aminotransferase class V-fold PLP-dependent enzyme [Neomegalonema sp.]|nr:aminotransferase class V-fold PLP-dependent enzyme [Neomegalonema sp.]
MSRVYLDWNATNPLRPEAREAMTRAMDVLGNPSSVHAEGRQARKIVEDARRDVAQLAACEPAQVIFTSGATEAAALAVAQITRTGAAFLAPATEHDCVFSWTDAGPDFPLTAEGAVDLDHSGALSTWCEEHRPAIAWSLANSETGIMPGALPTRLMPHDGSGGGIIVDAVQAAGRCALDLSDGRIHFAILSAHKLGGPKGIGCLINKSGTEVGAALKGGGQELGQRSGTENVLGIAGFGAAARAAGRDIALNVWAEIARLRDQLEARMMEAAPDARIIGAGARRLPNTTCVAVPGWRAETQVIQMDLAGIAISAGSACSSGKVKSSRVLQALGYDESVASSAIRVSLGQSSTRADIDAFLDAWTRAYQRWSSAKRR